MKSTIPLIDGNQVLVARHLPEGGMAALMDLPLTPLINARGWYELAHGPAEPPEAGFPMEGVVMAPNSEAFLRALGKPLGIAQDLESRPGVWLLTTANGQHSWVIFSDSHRKNSWKGGQVCAVYDGARENFTLDSRVVTLLRQSMTQVWGVPDPVPHMMDWSQWFNERGTQQPETSWPKQDGSAIPVVRVRQRGPKR